MFWNLLLYPNYDGNGDFNIQLVCKLAHESDEREYDTSCTISIPEIYKW